MFTSVTGVSGSGKSSLVSQVLVELVAERLGQSMTVEEPDADDLEQTTVITTGGEIVSGMEHIAVWLWSIKSPSAEPRAPIWRLIRASLIM